MAKLEKRLSELAQAERRIDQQADEMAVMRTELSRLEAELSTVRENMARAKNQAQYETTSAIFDDVSRRKGQLQQRLDEVSSRAQRPASLADEVSAAMSFAHRLANISLKATADFGAAAELFEQINARLFLQFGPHQRGNRILTKITGGVVTIGNVPPPIEIYSGVTNRKALVGKAPIMAAADPTDKTSPVSERTR
ncbi:MAG TPA: hypothetical protein VG722_10040 [Tepidisphaeraceae bacterium]|nr:hypothetical protein [Tepidisphaeraceae bacterium]